MQRSITYPIFKDQPILCATSTRLQNLGFPDDDPDVKKVTESRKMFLKDLGVDIRQLVCLKQVHSDKIYLAAKNDAGKGAADPATRIFGYDALVTGEKGLALAVFTADCFPVFIYDKKKQNIAMVHAGWKGTAGKIVKSAVALLIKQYHSGPQELLVALGPAMRQCCYQVKEDVANLFGDSAVKTKEGYLLDLASEITKQLLEEGVNKDNIYDSKLCTACRNDLFFSYRKEGAKAGRMMSFMMLKEK